MPSIYVRVISNLADHDILFPQSGHQRLLDILCKAYPHESFGLSQAISPALLSRSSLRGSSCCHYFESAIRASEAKLNHTLGHMPNDPTRLPRLLWLLTHCDLREKSPNCPVFRFLGSLLDLSVTSWPTCLRITIVHCNKTDLLGHH